MTAAMSIGLRSLASLVFLVCLWAGTQPALAATWQEHRDAGFFAFANADYMVSAQHLETALATAPEGQASAQERGMILEKLTTSYFATRWFRRARNSISQWDGILKTSAGEPWVYQQRADRDRLALLVSEVLPDEAGEDLTIGLAADQSFEGAQETPATQLTSRGYAIHLVSLKTQDSADRSWAELKESFPDLLSDKDLEVRPIDLVDQGTFYRVHAFPFADAAEAKAACEKFRLLQQYCAVVTLD